MNYIAIDTSKKTMTLTAEIFGKFFTYADQSGLQSSATLMPAFDNLLKQAGASVKDLDCLGVCVGPGSFTGIRVGVTAVKALSYALNIPIVPFDSLEILAHQAAARNNGREIIISMLDSGNRNVYAAVYNIEENKPALKTKPSVLPINQTQKFLEQYKDKSATVIFDGKVFSDMDTSDYLEAHLCHDQIADIMKNGRQRFLDFNTLEPLYILPSQAEMSL